MDFICVIVILSNKIIEAAHKDRIFAICPSLDIIPFVVEQYRCGAAKNHGIFATCFKSDFPFTFPRISIVRPQVAVQADDVFRRSFRVISIFCRDIINFDAPASINLQIIFSIIQLFHDDNVVVINTVGNFDKAVVVSIFICRRSYRIGNLRIIVGCMICICLAIGPLFPCDSITRYISSIMAKRNRAFFISCGLIANGCTISCCDNGLITCR